VIGFVGAIIRKIYKNKDWETYQEIQKFLIYKSKVAKLLNIKQKLDIEKNINEYSECISRSNENYNLTGYPAFPPIKFEKGYYYLESYGKIDFLSDSEEKVFDLLFKNKNTIILFEQIGDTLWKDNEKYSLQAISKIIERIRKKFVIYGLHKEIIFTKRGKGYVLIQ